MFTYFNLDDPAVGGYRTRRGAAPGDCDGFASAK
jgi:hypothetical protein